MWQRTTPFREWRDKRLDSLDHFDWIATKDTRHDWFYEILIFFYVIVIMCYGIAEIVSLLASYFFFFQRQQ